MADLFISHSSMDVEWTRDLRRQLEAAGYTCWMAPDDVAGPTPWAEQILEAIEACRVMIVVVSRHANASAHVSKEVGAALEHDKPLLPIRTEAIVPTGSLNYLLQLVQWVDAFPGELAQHLDRIRRAVAYSIPAPTSADPQGGFAWPAAASTPPASTPPAIASPPAVASTPPPYVSPPAYSAYAAPEPAWTPQPAVDTPRQLPASRTPLLLAGSAGLTAAVLIIGGVIAFSGQRPAPTVAPSVGPTATAAAATVAPSVLPSVAPSVAPSVGPSLPPPTASVVPTPPASATPQPTAFTIATLPELVPATVDDAVLTSQTATGDQVLGQDASSSAVRSFLASRGRTPSDLLAVSARDTSGRTDLQIYLFYLPGIGGDELSAALMAAGTANQTGVQIKVVSVGGRTVTLLTSASQPPTYFYASHDVVIGVQSRDAILAAHAIAHTPAIP